jgi:hypothetical protein
MIVLTAAADYGDFEDKSMKEIIANADNFF